MENIIKEEKRYLEDLKNLKNGAIDSFVNENGIVKEMAGYLKLIYEYHDVQLIPDFSDCDEIDFINCFLTHDGLFALYEGLFRLEPFVLFYLQKHHSDIFEKFKDDLNVPSAQIRRYINHLGRLEKIEELCDYQTDIEAALSMLTAVEKSHVGIYDIEFVVAEIMVTEIDYIKLLKRLTTEIFNKIADSKKFTMQTKNIFGTTKEIYEEQQHFYKDLIKCIHDSDIITVMDCFLKHQNCFNLYIQDILLKSDVSLIENCREQCEVDVAMDMQAPRTRLFQYNNCLKSMKKICTRSEEIGKIETVYNLFTEILANTNNEVALHEIKAANIYVETLGALRTNQLFTIKRDCDSKPFNGIVYLFDKALIITRLTGSETKWESLYEGHIITTKLGTRILPNEKGFEVYFQEKMEKKYIHELGCSDQEKINDMISAIHYILNEQVAEERNNLQQQHQS